jgi:hypothetical protein
VNRIMAVRYVRCAVVALMAASGLVLGPRAASADVFHSTVGDVRQWHHEAVLFVKSMEEKGFIPSSSPVPGVVPYPPPYYLNVMVTGSTFLEEFRQAVEAELLRRHLDIARSPIGVTVINLDIDLLDWGGAVGARTQLVWRGSILHNGQVVVKSSDVLSVSRSDAPLYLGNGSLPPLASPGVAALGPAIPLRYAR